MIRKTNDEFINELRVINPLVRPLEQYAGSAVNIKCECLNCGHIWSVRPANLLFGKGCPVCNKIKATTKLKATRAAKNNLAEKHPELVLEWDLENNELRPEDYACGSDQEAHWVCSWCGEKWVMQIKKRALRGDGCPRCRKQATSFEEQAIFYYCKKIYKDAKNRDNHLGFEIDVFIPEPNLAIEYDGLRWHKSKDALTRDNKKDLMCKEAGIDLVRFRDQSLPTTEYARIIPCKDSDHSALEESIRELLFSV